MSIRRFKLRSLFLLMTLSAIFCLPAYERGVKIVESWNKPKEVTAQLPTLATTTVNTVVSVPDGGTIIIGGIKIKPDGSKWVRGKQIGPPRNVQSK